MDFFLSAVVGLMMGGLPTGRAVGFIANDPVLAQGTGNPGALMWLKQGRLGMAAMAFVLEAGKVIAAMQLAWLLTIGYAPLLVAGVVAVIAHSYSPFSKFRPCRTFSAFIGFALAANTGAGILLAGLWLGTFFITLRQYRSVAVVLGALPVAMYVFRGYEAAFAAVILFAFGLWHYRRGLWQTFRNNDMPWPKAALMKTLTEKRL
tara:strand:- start:109288 stop:109902 length:615 start_codon:yes stop_codon:yes gene_type:complete